VKIILIYILNFDAIFSLCETWVGHVFLESQVYLVVVINNVVLNMKFSYLDQCAVFLYVSVKNAHYTECWFSWSNENN